MSTQRGKRADVPMCHGEPIPWPFIPSPAGAWQRRRTVCPVCSARLIWDRLGTDVVLIERRDSGNVALDCLASRASRLEDRTNWTDTEHWTQADRLLKAARVGVLEGDVEGQLVEALGAVVAVWLECIQAREIHSVVSGAERA